MAGTSSKINDAITCQMQIFPDSMEKKQIAVLAYALWQFRGCPFGSPETDWFRAEREIKKRRAASILDAPLRRYST